MNEVGFLAALLYAILPKNDLTNILTLEMGVWGVNPRHWCLVCDKKSTTLNCSISQDFITIYITILHKKYIWNNSTGVCRGGRDIRHFDNARWAAQISNILMNNEPIGSWWIPGSVIKPIPQRYEAPDTHIFILFSSDWPQNNWKIKIINSNIEEQNKHNCLTDWLLWRGSLNSDGQQFHQFIFV